MKHNHYNGDLQKLRVYNIASCHAYLWYKKINEVTHRMIVMISRTIHQHYSSIITLRLASYGEGSKIVLISYIFLHLTVMIMEFYHGPCEQNFYLKWEVQFSKKAVHICGDTTLCRKC